MNIALGDLLWPGQIHVGLSMVFSDSNVKYCNTPDGISDACHCA
jgi:hypothetical protein